MGARSCFKSGLCDRSWTKRKHRPFFPLAGMAFLVLKTAMTAKFWIEKGMCLRGPEAVYRTANRWLTVIWSQPQGQQSEQKDPSRPTRRRRRIRGHLQPRALPAVGDRIDTEWIEPHHRHHPGLQERIKAAEQWAYRKRRRLSQQRFIESHLTI